MKTTISFVQRLHSCGLRPTPQRVAVFTYLCKQEHHRHPSAEEVYTALVSEYPTLSRTTVYQTLESLCKCGLIVKVAIDGGEMLFEADTSDHGHFKCTQCGKIYDLFYTQPVEFPHPPAGFEVKESHIYCKGICRKCNTAASPA